MSEAPITPTLIAPSIKRRMASWLYEGMLLFGVIFIAGYLFSALAQAKDSIAYRTPLMFFLFVVLGIYFAWLGHKGQTLAMKTWHLKVVDKNHQNISQTRGFVRYILSYFWFLPPLFLASVSHLPPILTSLIFILWVCFWALISWFNPYKQFWHDYWAGCFIIHQEPVKKIKP
jgi:uncharacterized RDD family membrane protein YckC